MGEHLLVLGDRLAGAARRLVGVREVVARDESAGVVGAQNPQLVGEHLLVLGDRLAKAPRRLVGARQVAPGGDRVRVAGAQNPHAFGEHLLEQGDREVVPALLQVPVSAGVPFGGGIDGGHSSLDSGDEAGDWFVSRSRVSRFSRTVMVRGWSGLRASSHTSSVSLNKLMASWWRPAA